MLLDGGNEVCEQKWTHRERPVSYTHLDVYKRQIIDSKIVDACDR